MNNLQVNPTHKFNASLLFFIVCKVQIGVGVYGFQSAIYENAKQDSWISIIISFLAAHLLVIVLFKTLEMYESEDIYGIHLDLFGKYFGNFINVIFIIYGGMMFFTIIKNFSEIIITWVFPDLAPSFIIITVLLLVIYAFTGGFRVLIGLCFICFFLPQWMVVVLLYPIEYANTNYLFPVLDNNLSNLLKGAYSMTFTIVGFEVFNVLYPFIKEKNKAKLYVHLGLLYTLGLYLFVMLISLTFFSGEQLEKSVWATLSLFSIIRLPFLERIEIFTVCFWIVIILPNLCIYAWFAYRGFNRIIRVNEKKFILIFTMLIFIGSLIVKSQIQLKAFSKIAGDVSFYLVFVFPLFVYVIAVLKKKIIKRQVRKS